MTGDRLKKVRLHELSAPGSYVELGGVGGMVDSFAFSADGRRIVGSGRRDGIRIWSVDGSAKVQTLRESTKTSFQFVDFSPDGRRVVSGSTEGAIVVWDVDRGEILQWWKAHKYTPIARFSPDGRSIASTSSDGFVRTWDATTGAPRQEFNLHARVSSLHFSPDGERIFAGLPNGTLHVFRKFFSDLREKP